MKAYVITMYRWGDRERHSYVLGVSEKKYKAMKMVDAEEESRGGKYVGEILEIETKTGEIKTIKEASIVEGFEYMRREL